MDDKKQKAIAEIQRVAKLLGVTSLTHQQFVENSNLSTSTIRSWFGSWNKAIEAAGLLPNPTGVYIHPKISDDVLLQEIIRLTTELGKQPTLTDMSAFGRYSVKPYKLRWGKFSEAVKVAYAKYGYPLSASRSNINQRTIPSPSKPIQAKIPSMIQPATSRKKVQYGEPIDFRGLRHAPVNEQGVVYLFGMVSRELGFLIESLRTAYPDCEGKRCVDEKRQLWENVLIEFEFKSSNFREHGHKIEGCDLIVCWIHDWQDCPLEVLELRSATGFLSNK